MGITCCAQRHSLDLKICECHYGAQAAVTVVLLFHLERAALCLHQAPRERGRGRALTPRQRLVLTEFTERTIGGPRLRSTADGCLSWALLVHTSCVRVHACVRVYVCARVRACGCMYVYNYYPRRRTRHHVCVYVYCYYPFQG